ncbi:nucleotide-diphospho-sugar transferase [Polychytrium aggregatum]|uniref:nucleotide-diphospho-sugar transferase n=1 Tax=Polychytrium aggregatum TaxID=110093 RepID=UPI0022FE8398|nr:nucleotide-diphospho-sugar transferase [Polychytrium aggregatum]KAI9209179.1 nucleotide-diphospho-sugar transferase [Polychytrium aggregatum]
MIPYGAFNPAAFENFAYDFDPRNPSSALEAAIAAAHLTRDHLIPNTRIPRIIHQTWKTSDIDTEATPEHVRVSVGSWKKENPGYVYILWSDHDAEQMVRQFYPSWFKLYKDLPVPVMKADLLRYLVLHKFGGVYSDADTKVLRKIDDWVHAKDLTPWMYKNETMAFTEPVAAIIGLETDVPKKFGDEWKGFYQSPNQMCQWTMAMVSGHPIAAAVSSLSFHKIAAMSKNELKHADVTKITGPGPWTEVINRYMAGHGVDWRDLREYGPSARQMGDMLLFPITAFSPGLGEVLATAFGDMGGGRLADPEARVQHMWAGTWR